MRMPIAGTSVPLAIIALALGGAALLACFVSASPYSSERVSVVVKEAARSVDVTIDGKAFTSYIWPTTLKKPVLYPLRTAEGPIVTRGFPPRKAA